MLHIRKYSLIVTLSLFASQFLFPTGSFAGTITTNDTASYFRVIWGLLVVLGIILILYAFVKKRFSLLATGTGQQIKIVEIKPLMGKKALCLVSVKGQEHLLGISGDNITHLAALTPQPASSFAEVLQTTGVNS